MFAEPFKKIREKKDNFSIKKELNDYNTSAEMGKLKIIVAYTISIMLACLKRTLNSHTNSLRDLITLVRKDN